MGAEPLLQCYNKGCGQQFDPSDNNEEKCLYHAGCPVFHDAYKSWSCCQKRTTDFTEFLNIKGCTKGPHSSLKPIDPAQPKTTDKATPADVVKPPERLPRPSADLPLIPLPTTVSVSLQKMLANMSVSKKQEETEVTNDAVCQRKSCGRAKPDVGTSDDVCVHHPGSPIFHEGYKYWSCCKKKTTDFSEFIAQKGCSEGTHLWSDPTKKQATQCRFDWHQTGDTVSYTVYVKNVNPDLCTVQCNPVKLQLEISFGENHLYTFSDVLEGVIDPAKSKVCFFKTKVEVCMRKAEFVAWRKLTIQ